MRNDGDDDDDDGFAGSLDRTVSTAGSAQTGGMSGVYMIRSELFFVTISGREWKP